MPPLGWKRWLLIGLTSFLALLLAAAFVWRDDILRTTLDPEVPFQTYDPPPAPDYARAGAWAMRPGPAQQDRPVDIFFVHPTTYNGGPHWNGPVDDGDAARQLAQTMLPNYAGPFFKVGRVYAPRYRQASLYAYLTRRDDAVEARRFAYGDVERAFSHYLAHDNRGRPFIVVGVEQGGFLASRLVRDMDAAARSRLVAAYLIRTVVPAVDFADEGPLPPCRRRAQAACVVAYATAADTGVERARELLGRAMVWGEGEAIIPFRGDAVCVNPVLGRASLEAAPKRLNLGAANATGLEWGVRPPLLARQVSAQCVEGVLQVSKPGSSSLRASGGWADRLKVPGYNPVFADLEADAAARLEAWSASQRPAAPPAASRTAP